MSKTILSVDDSPSIRQMLKLTLSNAGYTVLQAEHGAEGLEVAKSNTASMVITDLNMPVMNGLALIAELRKLPSYKAVPIVFLTTESDDDMKQKARSAGATGWITKPFQQDQLLGVVKKLVGA
jgi:two-component system, chemotaxis family, chemotaxis protein CheY